MSAAVAAKLWVLTTEMCLCLHSTQYTAWHAKLLLSE